jgi:protein subunit release factor B
MEINPADIRTEYLVNGSTWFPRVTGIRLVHIPTGVSASSTSERSQHANREIAFESLVKQLKGAEKKFDVEQYGEKIGDIFNEASIQSLLKQLETPWRRKGVKPPEMEKAAAVIRRLLSENARLKAELEQSKEV